MAAWTDSGRPEKVLALWQEGKTSGEIAKAFNVNRNTVCGFLDRQRKKGGLPPRVTPLARVKMKDRRRNGPMVQRIAKKAAQKPVQLAPPIAPTSLTNVTLLGLEYGLCRFPVGEATGASQLFCGAKVDSLYLVYCDHHCGIAYQPAVERRKAAA